MEMFVDAVGQEVMSTIVLALAGLLTAALTGVAFRVAQYFGVKKDEAYLAKEAEWRDILHQTFARIAMTAVQKGLRDKAAVDVVVSNAIKSIPGTITNLTKQSPDAATINDSLRDIATSYVVDAVEAQLKR